MSVSSRRRVLETVVAASSLWLELGSQQLIPAEEDILSEGRQMRHRALRSAHSRMNHTGRNIRSLGEVWSSSGSVRALVDTNGLRALNVLLCVSRRLYSV